MNKLTFSTLILTLMSPIAVSTQAVAADGHAQIGAAVHDFIAGHYPATNPGSGIETASFGHRVEIDVAPLDPRLSIAACEVPLQVRLNQSQPPLGKVTVRVDCEDASRWSRYIAATVRVYQQVVFSTRPLNRGSIVSPGDLRLTEVDIATVRGSWLESIEDAVGMEVQRALSIGMPVTAEALTEPELVARGETVVLTAQRGSVVIRQQGVALQAGESGKQISVRNSNSARVVQAIVTGPGQAQVKF